MCNFCLQTTIPLYEAAFFVLAVIISHYAFAQKNEYGSIKGVVSTSDGKPAGSVTVAIKNTKNGTTTNDDGNFEFKKIKPGTYVIILSFVGFESKEISIDVKPVKKIS